MEHFDFTVLLQDLWHLLKHLFYWGTGPFIIWAIWWRKENFFGWIGLKKIRDGNHPLKYYNKMYIYYLANGVC